MPSQVRDEGKSQGLPVKDGESLPRCGENPQNCSNWANATITEKRPQMSNKVSQVGVKKGGGHVGINHSMSVCRQ